MKFCLEETEISAHMILRKQLGSFHLFLDTCQISRHHTKERNPSSWALYIGKEGIRRLSIIHFVKEIVSE